MKLILSCLSLAAAAVAQSPNAQFVERLPLPASNPTREVCAADFDRDGDVDVLLSEIDQLVLLSNDGTGRFAHTTLPGGSYNFLLAADMDGDGDVDAVGGGGGFDPVLARNDGSGGLSVESTALSVAFAGEGALIDLDGDGDLDLVWAQLLGSFGVGINDGAGNLAAAASPLPATPGGIYGQFVVADFNEDGRDDLVATGSRGYLALSAPGGFVAGDATLLPAVSAASAAADFDGDGHLDLVFVEGSQGRLLLGRGDGTFAVSPATFPGESLRKLVVGDLDEDGDLDIAGVDGQFQTTTPLYIWLNEPGGFVSAQGARVSTTAATVGSRIAIADLDGDRDLDLYVGASVLGLGSERDFVAINRHVQVEVDSGFAVPSIVVPGSSFAVHGSSRPGYGAGIDLMLTVIGFEAAAPVPTPFGEVHVAAANAISLPFIALSSPLGSGTLIETVPNDPNLIGLTFVLQGLVVDVFGRRAPRLTNFERIFVAAF